MERKKFDASGATATAEAPQPERVLLPQTQAQVEYMDTELDSLHGLDELLGAKLDAEVVRKAHRAYAAQIRKEIDKAKQQDNWSKAGKLQALLRYVPAHVKVLLFRLDHPGGLLLPWVEPGLEKGVRVWSYVYLKADQFAPGEDGRPGGQFAAVNCKTVSGADAMAMEKAVTGAHGRALADLGYGTVYGLLSAEDGAEEPQPAPQPRRELVGGSMAREAEGFRQHQQKAAAAETGQQEPQTADAQGAPDDRLERLQERFRQYVANRRGLDLAKVEQRFGPVADMDEQELLRVHSLLEKAKGKKLADLLGQDVDPDVAREWRDAVGGSPKEQGLSWLQELLDRMGEDSRDQRGAVVAAMEAMHNVQELDLMPEESQVQGIVDAALARINELDEPTE